MPLRNALSVHARVTLLDCNDADASEVCMCCLKRPLRIRASKPLKFTIAVWVSNH